MANIKSAKKRIKVTETKTAQNRMIKSALKTAIKNFEAAVTANNAEEAKAAYVKVSALLDRLASKKTISKNKAANLKSKLAKYINKLAA